MQALVSGDSLSDPKLPVTSQQNGTPMTLQCLINNRLSIVCLSKPNAKETSQRPEGDDKTTLGGFEGCLGFELGIAGHET
jgi:hypothetical protein